MNALQFSERLTLRVPPRELWRFLYDTDRLNRSMRIPSISFQPDPDKKRKGHYLAEMRFGPLRIRYDEYPFEWVEERFYMVLRRFHSGPFAELRGGIRMAPAASGTDLEIFGEVTPRGAVGRLLAHALLRKMAIDKVVAQVRAFEQGYLRSEKLPPSPSARDVAINQLESRLKILRSAPVDVNLIPLLKELVVEASDIEVTRIRAFELADRWDKERYKVLRFLLHATKAGIVDLNWEILCPHCKAPTATGATMSTIVAQSACETCEMSFRVDLANSVEAVFSVNRGIRDARREVYCIGGPANSPRIMAQFRLEPGEARDERVAAEPGLLVVRSYQSAGIVPLEVSETGPHEVTMTCGAQISASSARVASGAATIGLRNELKGECLLVIERETWRESAATAAIVTTIQEFRDLFPEEAVAPGQEIAMGRLAVLFTDLSGSTDLYERVGDVKAFDFVQSHFQFLLRLVAKHRGGVVKTMGDAIMAAFNSGLDAASAAVAMQEEWEAFISRYELPSAIRLKVGVHQGPTVAFNNKGAQDYFGGTVNMSARIQAQAKGGEIVISQALRDDPDVRMFVEARFPHIEPFLAHLKGIAADQSLHRLIVAQPLPKISS